jgi:hypothetical protein
MFEYILGILLLRRLGLSRPLRYAFLSALAVLMIVVLLYTANLFLTLEQRTSAPNVHTHSTH